MKRNDFKLISYFLITIFLTLGLSISCQSLLAAWTAPTNNPPDGNVDAPINEGAASQVKAGGLGVGGNFLVGTDVFFVDEESGKVGIGTTSPDDHVHVFTSVGTGGPLIRVQTSAPTRSADIHFQADGREWSAGVEGSDSGSLSNKFRINDVTGGINRFVIDTSGRVGIGIASPNSSLYIQDQNLNINWSSDEYSAIGSISGIKIENDDPKITLIGQDSSTAEANILMPEVNSSGIYTNLWTVGRRATTEGGGYFYIAYTFKGSGISFYNEASHKFVILPNGYVGIGVINPSYRLQLPNTASNAGRAQANRWDTYSSIRWKENIFPITQALDKINQLNGVYFDWKKEYGGKPDIGFIAEEVGKVIPELVSWTADGQYAESLNYDHLTALNLQGIKELETIIKEQQKQIDELKLGIEELRNLVNSKQ